MARLEGSFPLKFNGRVVGKAYIVGQDETGMILDIRFYNPELLESITELVRHDQLPTMSFGFITDPLKPKGLMQVIQPEPGYLDRARETISEMTDEEKAAASLKYMQEQLNKRD